MNDHPEKSSAAPEVQPEPLTEDQSARLKAARANLKKAKAAVKIAKKAAIKARKEFKSLKKSIAEK